MVGYTIGDALREGIALLNEVNMETASLDARILICHVLGCDSLYLTLHRDDIMDEKARDTYFDYISRRRSNEPVSYITGTKEFMSLEFKVTPDVLIPRPDTEILVEKVISETKDIPCPHIIDMCTGSGAIAVSLARYIEGSRVTALDISPSALEIAKFNAESNGADVKFELHDAYKPYCAKADVLVSNPPYIPTEDISELETNVVGYEPHLALDGGRDGLDFYRAITKNAPHCLKSGGILAFEVGMGQADDVEMIMKPLFENITRAKDLAGIERVVCGYLRSDTKLL